MTFEEFVQYQQDYLPFGHPALGENDIYYFDTNDEWFDELMSSVNFYTEAIQHNSYYLNELPCRLIFSNHISENAKATVYDHRGVIVWHAGLLLRQLDVLRNHVEIENSIFNSRIRQLIELQLLDNHPSILFHQFGQHFTFYHEFAHIIQQRNRIDSTSFKFPNEDLPYSLNNHVLEIDADIFASLCLSVHILQYAKEISKDAVSRQNLLMLISMFSASFLVYSMKISESDLENNDLRVGYHPNPLFRILFAVLNICEYVNQSGMVEESNFDFREVLDLSLEVASNLTGFNLFDYWSRNFHAFMEYFKEIDEAVIPDGYESAVNAWNISK